MSNIMNRIYCVFAALVFCVACVAIHLFQKSQEMVLFAQPYQPYVALITMAAFVSVISIFLFIAIHPAIAGRTSPLDEIPYGEYKVMSAVKHTEANWTMYLTVLQSVKSPDDFRLVHMGQELEINKIYCHTREYAGSFIRRHIFTPV